MPTLDPDLIALDAMGVLYETRDEVHEKLIPFCRERGSPLEDSEIEALYSEATVTNVRTGQLWKHLGIPGDLDRLDEEFLSDHRLTPGAIDFLEAASRNGYRLACISNHVAGWMATLRRLHALDRYITSWTVSAHVGVRKPDAGILQRFLDETGWRASRCLLVDDRTANLAAARELGFSTVLFGSNPEEECWRPSAAAFDELASLLDARRRRR